MEDTRHSRISQAPMDDARHSRISQAPMDDPRHSRVSQAPMDDARHSRISQVPMDDARHSRISNAPPSDEMRQSRASIAPPSSEMRQSRVSQAPPPDQMRQSRASHAPPPAEADGTPGGSRNSSRQRSGQDEQTISDDALGPHKKHLIFGLRKDTWTARLILKNPFQGEQLQYKVKSNHPEKFRVKPNAGVIGPNQAPVTINFEYLQNASENRASEKFELFSIVLTREKTNGEVIKKEEQRMCSIFLGTDEFMNLVGNGQSQANRQSNAGGSCGGQANGDAYVPLSNNGGNNGGRYIVYNGGSGGGGCGGSGGGGCCGGGGGGGCGGGGGGGFWGGGGASQGCATCGDAPYDCDDPCEMGDDRCSEICGGDDEGVDRERNTRNAMIVAGLLLIVLIIISLVYDQESAESSQCGTC